MFCFITNHSNRNLETVQFIIPETSKCIGSDTSIYFTCAKNQKNQFYNLINKDSYLFSDIDPEVNTTMLENVAHSLIQLNESIFLQKFNKYKIVPGDISQLRWEPTSDLFNHPSHNIGDFFDIKLGIPSNYDFIYRFPSEYVKEISSDLYTYIHFITTNRVTNLAPFGDYLFINPKIRFPLHIIVNSKSYYTNCWTNANFSYPPLALSSLGTMPYIAGQGFAVTGYSKSPDRIIQINIVDSHYAKIPIYKDSYIIIKICL